MASKNARQLKGIILTSNGLASRRAANRIAEIIKKILGRTDLVGLRVAYVAVASEYWLLRLHVKRSVKAWLDFGVDLRVIDFNDSPAQIHSELQKSDVLYVEGGNTFHLLYQFRRTGIDAAVLRDHSHLIYIGASAGSIVAGPNILPASLAGDPNWELDQTDLRGLGLIPLIVWPHYSLSSRWRMFFSMPGRREFRTLFFKKIIQLRDGEGIVQVGRGKISRF